jgi:hypothetical protein
LVIEGLLQISNQIRFALSREKELYLEAQLPVGATLVRSHHVVKSLQLKIDRRKLVVELEYFADPSANRQRPAVVAGTDPVCRDNRRAG